MVYIHSWQEFQDAAEALYLKSPDKARYCVKWRSEEGKLVLKITDDVTCLKFKTHSSIFLNRFEALNMSLMQKMQNHKPRASTPAVINATPDLVPPTEGDRGTSPGPSQAPSNLPNVSVAGGGVKKKKPKKKK